MQDVNETNMATCGGFIPGQTDLTCANLPAPQLTLGLMVLFQPCS